MSDREIPNLSATEAVILRLMIASAAESYGLDLVKRSGGDLKRGTIYVTLQRMEEKGFVESRPEPVTDEQIGAQRRLYRITGLGQRALTAREMVGAFMARGHT